MTVLINAKKRRIYDSFATPNPDCCNTAGLLCQACLDAAVQNMRGRDDGLTNNGRREPAELSILPSREFDEDDSLSIPTINFAAEAEAQRPARKSPCGCGGDGHVENAATGDADMLVPPRMF